MPARTCGRRNISPRCQLLMDSLAPGKSRPGNRQLPPEIHLREQKKMLFKAVLRQSAGKTEVRDFRREAGAWNVVAVFSSKVQLVGFLGLLRGKCQ